MMASRTVPMLRTVPLGSSDAIKNDLPPLPSYKHGPKEEHTSPGLTNGSPQSREGRNHNRVARGSTTAPVARNNLLTNHDRAFRRRCQRAMSGRCQSLTRLPLRSTTGFGKSR